MEIFDGDIRYRISFSHIRTCFKTNGKMDMHPHYTKVRTLCEVFTGSSKENEVLVGSGYSLVLKDEFSRLVGRYISFYRALDNMGLNEDMHPHLRELRRTLLKSFHESNNRGKAEYICRTRGFDLSSVIDYPYQKRSPNYYFNLVDPRDINNESLREPYYRVSETSIIF